MALVLEDGTGLSTAESYVSVADLDTFEAAHSDSFPAGVTTAQKEEALRDATGYLDAQFGSRFVGTRGTRTQALEWPRIDAIDRSGFELESDALPRELEAATKVLAIEALNGATLMPTVDRGGSGQKRLMQKVGPLEQETEWFGDSASKPIFSRAVGFLGPILRSGVGYILERA